MAAVHPGH